MQRHSSATPALHELPQGSSSARKEETRSHSEIDSIAADRAIANLRDARVEELTSAAVRKDQFLALLSHELRGPLSSIQHAIGVLRRHGDVTVQQGMHELIERQVRQMTLLASGLMDATRMGRGDLRINRERVDLRAVLSNAIETMEPEFARRRHRLLVTWPDSSPWVLADAGRMEQVFVNLLANAAKYTDAGGELAISVHVVAEDALVRVTDSGIGIAAEVLPHIFGLYMQAESSPGRARSGLGIGLTLVRTIVELHGGSVSAASAGLGRGSEFTVRLPIQDAPGSPQK